MTKCNVSINQERTVLSAIHSVNSLIDAIRELLMNCIDAIVNFSLGRILVDVKENVVEVYDNGCGCLDHEKFTTFRNQSDESRLISYEGIGMKTLFQFFDRLDIFSKSPDSEQILRVDNFRVFDDNGEFNPSYSFEVIGPDSPCYEGFKTGLKGYNTKVIASQPKPETSLKSLFAKQKKERAASHILNIAEEPIRYLEQGGEILVANFDNKREKVTYHGFKSPIIEFTSDKDMKLFDKTVKNIHSESPEKAVQIKLCVSPESLGTDNFQEIYLEDSKLKSSVVEYVKPVLKNGIRKGSSARIQMRLFLSQYYKTHNRLNHNKHNLKDDHKLQEYLAQILKICEKQTRKIAVDTPKKAKKTVFSMAEMAKINTYARVISKKYEANEKVTGQCKVIIKCLNELETELKISQAA